MKKFILIEYLVMVHVIHFLGELIRFSQQALMDCSWGFGNNACDGGEDFRVYQFMMKHGGIPTEDSYGPYLGNDGFCHMNESNIEIGLQIKGYVNVTSGILKFIFCYCESRGMKELSSRQEISLFFQDFGILNRLQNEF